jgi:hypothetical protein
MSSSIYRNPKHVFTTEGSSSTILLTPGTNETLNIGGLVNSISIPGNVGGFAVDGVPIGNSGGVLSVSKMSLTSGSTPLFQVTNWTSDFQSPVLALGNDFFGYVHYPTNTGNSSGKTCSITLGTPLNKKCYVQLTPGLCDNPGIFYVRNNTHIGFDVYYSGNAQPSDSYSFFYNCIESLEN